MNISAFKESIDQCLKNAEIDEALRIAVDFFRANNYTKSYEKIIVLSARWVKIQSEHRLGLLTDFERNRVLGQTILEIKEIINKLELSQSIPPKNKRFLLYFLSMAAMVIFMIGYFYFIKINNIYTNGSNNKNKTPTTNTIISDSLSKGQISDDGTRLDKPEIDTGAKKKNVKPRSRIPEPTIEESPQKYKLKIIIPSRMSDGIIFIDGKEPNILDRTTNFIYIEVPQKEENYEIRIDKSGQETCILKIAIRTDNTVLYPCQQ